MKTKIKIIFISFIVLIFALIPIINIFAQGSFVNTTFVRDLVNTARQFENTTFSIEVVNTSKPSSEDLQENPNAVFKLQTNIILQNESLLGSTGKYFSALFIDDDGVFDLGDVFVSDTNEPYNPKIMSVNDGKLQTYLGTEQGNHLLIGILSDDVPYFGNIYNNAFGSNSRARTRYLENVKSELERVSAMVYVLPFNININQID